MGFKAQFLLYDSFTAEFRGNLCRNAKDYAAWSITGNILNRFTTLPWQFNVGANDLDFISMFRDDIPIKPTMSNI